METKDILKRIDHTLLTPSASWDEIKILCDEAYQYSAAAVCIPPCYVKQAAAYLCGKVAVCTVIGFPNGYSTTNVKCYEAKNALLNGADEIDMVINIGWIKDKKFADIFNEIRLVKDTCASKVLKVIIETCLLTDEEKIKMCEAVYHGGADYIKTSTGFSSGGASKEDIKLLREYCEPSVMIKASGGIKTLEDAITFIELGADRIGSSSILKNLSNT